MYRVSRGDKQPYTGKIELQDLSLQLLKFWLPDQAQLSGQANGNLEFINLPNEIQITSDLEVSNGVLNILQNQGVAQHRTVIKTMKLTAHSNQASTGFTLELLTDSKDFLNIVGNITKAHGEWQIDAQVKGVIENTELITQLSSEISDIDGNFKLMGNVSGKLKQPVIKLEFQQSNGFVQFSRLGTLVENLKLKVVTENITNPEYKIQVSGQNQGSFDIEGSLSHFEQGWQYQGNINGDNFMVLNTPELQFNVSPKLNIKANQHAMTITGDLFIDQGQITVKQLPPATESNSNDLVIHQLDDLPADNQYAINWDINTQIKKRLKLDVIGLNAVLTGGIQLNKFNNKALQANGVLSLEEGVYEIYGQKLTINKGELFFNGPIDNPRLDIRASRKSLDETVVAGVQLGGTVNQLQSQLFSEPILRDIEILSYIMTGSGINQADNINVEQLTQAAILLGLNQGTTVFKEIQNTFGIDVLTVKESANTSDAVIEAGKRINDKLYVSYNQGIFNRLGFWVLKYKINEFLNLQTTQGEDQSIELVYTRKATVKPEKNE